jgi:hypothetical protein
MNVFYWFFPARESPETAPISIWIGGGPGEAAIEGAMTENGPCYVNSDGNSTVKNPFSRNSRVNMLYIDQPVGTGYSYSSLVNVTYSQLSGAVIPTDFTHGIPFAPNITVFPGTVANPDLSLTANNSDIAAKAMWHVAQAWVDTFPHFSLGNSEISLWTNSVSRISQSGKTYGVVSEAYQSKNSTVGTTAQQFSDTGNPKIKRSKPES